MNLDVAYEVSERANLAGGFERREERFAIGQGQDESWQIGPYAAQGFSSSSNGFPGFSPLAAGNWSRRNTAVYGDLNLGGGADRWTLGFAGRYEDFSDFGGKATGKISARVEASDQFAFRASANTGYRAPTPGQQNAFNVSTVFDADIGDLVNRGTIPSTSDVARLRGGEQLRPETSASIAAGIVYEGGDLRLTTDYFRISIQDRFAQTQTFKLTDAEVAQLISEGITSAANLAEFRFFTNNFATLTQGIDFVANYTPSAMDGNTTFSMLFNVTNTEVTDRDPDVVGDSRVYQLEESLPGFRGALSAVHPFGPVRALFRGTYYDGWYDVGDEHDYPGRFIVDAEFAMDLPNNAAVTFGVQNLLNTYPAESPTALNVGAQYPESTPFGFNGGYYYVRLNYNWLWETR